jgi:hypothetical protein
MKRMFTVVAVLILLSSFATAQDENIRAFASEQGASMRLAALEAALMRNILWGEEIIGQIQESNPEADTGELEDIVDEMRLLVDEMRGINASDNQEAASEFITVKGEAKSLTDQFRTLSKDMLGDVEKNQLRERLRNIKDEQLEERRQRMQELRMGYNAENAEKILDAIGVQNPDLVGKIRDGELGVGNFTRYVKGEFQAMNNSGKKDALHAVREADIKLGVFQWAALDRNQAVEKALEKVENRMLAAKGRNMSEGVINRLQLQKERLSSVQLNIQNRTQARIENVNRLENKSLEQLDKMADRIQNRSDNIEGWVNAWVNNTNRTDVGQKRLENLDNRTTNALGKIDDRKENVMNRADVMRAKLSPGGNGQ